MSERQARQVVVIDDHQYVRVGLKQALAAHDVRVVAGFDSVEDFLKAIDGAGPSFDAVFLDMVLDSNPSTRRTSIQLEGSAAVRAILDRCPGRPIIIVTSEDRAGTLASLLDVGAAAIVSKSAIPETMRAALDAALNGNAPFLDPTIAGLREAVATGKSLKSLSALEFEALRAREQGLSDGESAERAGRTTRRAAGSMNNVLASAARKLGFRGARDIPELLRMFSTRMLDPKDLPKDRRRRRSSGDDH